MNASKMISVLVWTAAAFVLAVVFPAQRGIVAVAWALWLFSFGLIQMRASVRSLMQSPTSPFERVIARVRRTSERPQDLIRCEHAFGWKVYEPRDFDHHVRPLLRELVNDRIRRRYGVGPDIAPESVRVDLDPLLLALAGNEPAEEIFGHSIRTNDIADVVDRIERLS
jgi:hypothetical protein